MDQNHVSAATSTDLANTNMDLQKILWPSIVGSLVAHLETLNFKRYLFDKTYTHLNI